MWILDGGMFNWTFRSVSGGPKPGCHDLRDVGRVAQHRARLAIGILGRAGLELLLDDVVEEVRVLKIGDVVEES